MTEETIHETDEQRSRRGVSTFFRRIARRLRRGEKVPVNDEQSVTIDPPAEAELEVEVEREDGELSLEIEMEWDSGEDDVDIEAEESKATFELYEDNAEEYRWRLVHDNGNIIADSGEGYTTKQNAENGLESVKRNAAGAHVIDLNKDEAVESHDSGSNATFEIFLDSAEDWRWRLRHTNSEIIADGGQGYSSKQKAKQGMYSVKSNAAGASVQEL